jgi:hypothetical protein
MTSAEWIASKKFSKLFNGSSQQQLFLQFFLDFKLLYPKANDFDKSFKEKYLNEIFLLANRKSVDIPESPDGKQIFIFICQLFPCMTYFFTECFKSIYVLLKLTPSITKLRKVNLKLVFERLIVL